MSGKTRPYFLWDYDLSEDDVRRILRGDNEVERIWMMGRVLESAKFEDVWKYVNLREVKEAMPKLKLKKPIRSAWEYAISVWGWYNKHDIKLQSTR